MGGRGQAVSRSLAWLLGEFGNSGGVVGSLVVEGVGGRGVNRSCASQELILP